MQDNVFGVPKATMLKLSSRANQFGKYIRANLHHIKNDVPVCVLFRALGVESDMDICRHVVYDAEDDDNADLLAALVGSVEDGHTVRTQKQALDYLSRYLNIGGYPRDVLNHPDKRIAILRTVLAKEFLPHVGANFADKALYLGYMTRKLLRCQLKHIEFDDRDR